MVTNSGTGSAFYIGNNEFVTAAHVVSGSSHITLTRRSWVETATLVGFYPSGVGDIALLTVPSTILEPLAWSASVEVGDTVGLAGFPLGVWPDPSVTRGVVSYVTSIEGVSTIQHDAASNSGNSGGPLFDCEGDVAGMHSYRFRTNPGAQPVIGMGFAISQPSLGEILQKIRTGVPPPTTWAERDRLVNGVLYQWNATVALLNALSAEWNAIIGSVSLPSQRLADIATRQRDLAAAKRNQLISLRSLQGAQNPTANHYLEAAITYWWASWGDKETARLYALAQVPFSAVEQAVETRRAAFAEFTRAECALYRLQQYPSAAAVCAQTSSTGLLDVKYLGLQEGPAAGSGVDAVPGQTLTVAFTGTTEDRFRISTDSEGSATFAHNGGQALRCSNNHVTGCDVNNDSTSAGISVRVAVDEDSPFGEIYVQQISRNSTGVVSVTQEVVVTVNGLPISQPSGLPHRFTGSVTLDGQPAAAGTSVTAIINGTACGSATVIASAAGSTYALDVPDHCANDGDTVSFQVGGYDAAETGTWSGGGYSDVDLSASSGLPQGP